MNSKQKLCRLNNSIKLTCPQKTNTISLSTYFPVILTYFKEKFLEQLHCVSVHFTVSSRQGKNKTEPNWNRPFVQDILGIYWPDKISYKELEKRTCIPQIDRELKKRRWTWIGHVLRMNSDANPKVALTWTPEGKRKRGRPRELWRRTAIKEREAIGWRSWNLAESRSKNRAEWRAGVVAHMCLRARRGWMMNDKIRL